MTKGPLRSSTEDTIEYWSRKLFGKKYEYLTDDQADQCWKALADFVLQWRDETEGAGGEK